MKLRRQLSFCNEIVKPAARMHHSITCRSALLCSCRHNTQRSVTKRDNRISIKPLAGELGPDIPGHFLHRRCLNVEANAVACSYGPWQLRSHGIKCLRMLAQFFQGSEGKRHIANVAVDGVDDCELSEAPCDWQNANAPLQTTGITVDSWICKGYDLMLTEMAVEVPCTRRQCRDSCRLRGIARRYKAVNTGRRALC